jgi:hypothetical protein
VTGDDYIGGLVGSNSGEISDSYSKCPANGDGDVGGLVGGNEGQIAYSFAAGTVTGNSSLGGLIGSDTEGTITSCCWDTQTSGQSTSAGGTGKNTADMKQQETYTDWNFTTVWGINVSDNGGYPFLRWQGYEHGQVMVPPILSGTGASNITATSADLSFTSDKAGTYYYLVYEEAAAAPDAAAIKAQGEAVAKGTAAAVTGANIAGVSGLAPSTAYKAYVVVEEVAGNISDVAVIDITTIAAPPLDAVIDAAAIAGVTVPVRGAAPVTTITDTTQYSGTVSWSPAVVGNKFSASTAYTATITLTAKEGYTLSGVGANFFTVAGATATNTANAGVVTAVFSATEAEPVTDTGGDDSGDSGGGDDSTGSDDSPAPSSVPPTVITNLNNTVITSEAISKVIGMTPEGKTVETFTVQNTAASQIEKAKEEGKSSVEFNIASSQTSLTDIIIPSTVLENATGLNVSVSTPHATLELPAALVDALAAAGQNLNLTVSRGGELADPEGGTILSASTEITSDIVGETQVTIPLSGISIPADSAERAAFLSSLAVFTYHSDGETELITGEIIYDANGNPASISFPVDKFSTFAIVKLDKRTVALTIGSTAASLNSLPVAMEAPAYVELQSNRTLVPLQFFSEALGARVEWLPNTRQVKVRDGKTEILITVDSRLALLNGQSVEIDCAPVLAPSGRTLLPVRFIGEALGAEVAYDEGTKGITITREYRK